MARNELDLKQTVNLQRLVLPLTPRNFLTALRLSRIVFPLPDGIGILLPKLGVMQAENRVATIPRPGSEPTILEVSPDRLNRPLPSTSALVVTFLAKQERG